jgi:arachidonate 5-lipoxygenase
MISKVLKKAQLWLYSYGYAGLLIVVVSFWQRVRMSHNNGTTATGRIKIVDAPAFPEHDFLTAGREFACRLRHASVSYDDDTVIQVRAASLKFAESRYDSPLDLEMNTGTISLFWTARNFLEFFSTQEMVNDLAFSRFYDKYPLGLAAAKDGIRKYPETFAQMYYHAQTAQLFLGKDGVKRYCKFRLIPEDRGPETGLIPLSELEDRWVEVAAPGEPRSQNYLKEEFAERVKRGPVVYHLQIQLHTPSPDDSPEILSCSVAWDEATHPFMDVATVEVDTLLSLDENNLMRFAVDHCPPSLGVLPAESIDDYNSINYMRAASASAKSARLFFYKIFGMPKPVPDQRPKSA